MEDPELLRLFVDALDVDKYSAMLARRILQKIPWAQLDSLLHVSAALLIATKYNQDNAWLLPTDFVRFSMNPYAIVFMERKILETLSWRVQPIENECFLFMGCESEEERKTVAMKTPLEPSVRLIPVEINVEQNSSIDPGWTPPSFSIIRRTRSKMRTSS